MIRFIALRVARSFLTILGVLTVVFFLARLAGDPVALLLPVQATNEDIARLRAELGLDQPLPVQYVNFLGQAAQGDFGDSIRQQTPALELVLERLPATLELAFAAFFLGIALAFACGLLMQIST
ncbi:MAG: ABC transporter permease, partial [Gaiellales bacterium]